MFDRGFIPWVIVGVLGVLLIWSLSVDSGEPTVVEKHTTDTLVFERVDTLYITDVVTKIEKEPSDTVYITTRDSILVPVPRREYAFSEPDVFDFSVKGYDVEFLDAKVYPKTVYKTVTNTIEREIYKDARNCYLGVGIWAFDREIVPTVNLTIKTRNKWLFGANIGYYDKSAIYGVNLSYKIIGK